MKTYCGRGREKKANGVSDTMLMVPSTVIRREDGTAVAWGYLGVDGSVSTLHVEVSICPLTTVQVSVLMSGVSRNRTAAKDWQRH